MNDSSDYFKFEKVVPRRFKEPGIVKPGRPKGKTESFGQIAGQNMSDIYSRAHWRSFLRGLGGHLRYWGMHVRGGVKPCAEIDSLIVGICHLRNG